MDTVNTVRVILSIVVALLLVATGGGKVLRLKYSQPGREQLRLSSVFWSITGSLELAAVVGLVWGIWFVPFGLASAIGVVLLMIGAIVFRFRSGSAAARRGAVADIVLLLISTAIIVLSVLAL
jgi:DoxX-like family